ncbi:MAG: hypothetical protein JWO06_488, partial [Bacteroidota bacterium]|nr:hypothetical protein [Bacteroidota bacterium]
MKRLLILIIISCTLANAFSQTTSSVVYILKLYSPNKKYYLVTLPYDNEEESTYGETRVYQTSNDSALYTLNRDFNYTYYPNKINLSNNGQTLTYVNDLYRDDKMEDLKTLLFYQHGALIKSYTTKQLNNCDDDTAHCHSLYDNPSVLCRDSDKFVDHAFCPGFKPGVSDTEKFAINFNTFFYNDTLYLLNSDKKVMRFSATTGNLISSTDYNADYSYLKTISRVNDCVVTKVDAPPIYKLPLLADGGSFEQQLAKYIGMKLVDDDDRKANANYKIFYVVVDCIISRNGKTVVNSLKGCVNGWGLPGDSISSFLSAAKFDMSKIPAQLTHWRIQGGYIYFRSSSNSVARKEKEAEIEAEKEELKKQYVA